MTQPPTLTEKQAEVMHLVRQGYNSKQIGRLLHISPATVDQRADGARKKLGAATRGEAARLFAASKPMPECLIYDALPLTPDPQPPPCPGSPRDSLRFHDAAFDDRALWDRGSPWRLPDFEPQQLGIWGRLLFVLAGAVIIMLVAGEAVRFAASLGMLLPT